MTTRPPVPVPAADSGFAALGLSPSLCQVVAELGFATPTPVQARAIPLLLAGRDLIGQSSTGSGKTAAFGLAILQKLKRGERRPQALILCPTRELCAQVARELRKLGRREAGLAVLILSGGQPMKPQLAALQRGVHVVVGTPGRALDHIVRGSLDLSGVATVVVDEADRMLEMGFGVEMEKILERRAQAAADRLLLGHLSALDRGDDQGASARPRTPDRRRRGRSPGSVAPAGLRRGRRSDDARRARCWRSCAPARPSRRIVFCNFKATVARVEQALRAAGISSASLHGDLEQRDRDFVMAKFRNHSIRVLVATDVAARGLDIEGLDLVVNFELPFQPEIYVHRIGRTGRAGQAGLAVSLVGPQDRGQGEGDRGRDRVAAGSVRRRPRLEPAATTPGRRSRPTRRWRRCTSRAAARTSCVPATSWARSRARRADFPGSDVGKIEIHERFSYVAIAKGSADRAIERLGAGRIKGKKFKVGLPRSRS